MGIKFKKRIKIGDKWIGENEPCYIVGEVGLNHNGQLLLAKKLVDIGVECHVDAVKFQKRDIHQVLTKEALEQPYIKPTSWGKTYGEHRKALEFSNEEFKEISDYCKEKRITFFASVWDKNSADFVEKLDVPAFKIASADLTNLPLIEYLAKKGKPIILSTGMSTMKEIEEAVNLIGKHNKKLILLHCVSTYPSEYEEINLKLMETLKKKFNVLVGYSGHERGIAVSEAAATLGAVMIEKHFTIDRTLPGPDHAASLEPIGLQKLVRDIRNIEKSMGVGIKRILPNEKPIREKLAKSLVATKNISKGTIITKEMLTVKSPGTGLPPKYYYILPGKKAKRDIKGDSLIKREDIIWKENE